MTATAVAVVRGAAEATVILDDTRRSLLAALGEPDSAAGLARRLGLPRQRINYHLRLLERAGFVEPVEERRRGNCVERLVRASARGFVISPETLGSLGPSEKGTPDRASSACLVATAARAIREVAALDAAATAAGKRLAAFTLETEIRFGSAARRAAFLDELTAALGRLTAKYHDAEAPGGRSLRIVAFGHSTPAPEAR